jgi:hypothetical protein
MDLYGGGTVRKTRETGNGKRERKSLRPSFPVFRFAFPGFSESCRREGTS